MPAHSPRIARSGDRFAIGYTIETPRLGLTFVVTSHPIWTSYERAMMEVQRRIFMHNAKEAAANDQDPSGR